MNFLDAANIHNGRAMNAHKFEGVELSFKAAERFTGFEMLLTHMQPCVVAVCLDPIDPRPGPMPQ